jgi:hypothetical protein
MVEEEPVSLALFRRRGGSCLGSLRLHIRAWQAKDDLHRVCAISSWRPFPRLHANARKAAADLTTAPKILCNVYGDFLQGVLGREAVIKFVRGREIMHDIMTATSLRLRPESTIRVQSAVIPNEVGLILWPGSRGLKITHFYMNGRPCRAELLEVGSVIKLISRRVYAVLDHSACTMS